MIDNIIIIIIYWINVQQIYTLLNKPLQMAWAYGQKKNSNDSIITMR